MTRKALALKQHYMCILSKVNVSRGELVPEEAETKKHNVERETQHIFNICV